MTINTLQEYIQKIEELDRYQDPDKGYAPYKPFLLLSTIELIEQGEIYENKIPFSNDLIEIFTKYVSLTPEWNSQINNPFFHLQGKEDDNRFWHLHPIELRNSETTPSVRRLRDAGAYVNLDNELFDLLRMPEQIEIIRQAIINWFFP